MHTDALRRYTRLVDLGWRMYRYFARDVYREPARTVREIRRALSVRMHRPAGPR